MNKFNNPRLTNTTVSGTGVKHPMRPHVILGDPENGFIRGDLLDANAVIKLIKNAAKAIGALEELEKSDWINYNATAEQPVGVLQEGELGFVIDENEKVLVQLVNGSLVPVLKTVSGDSYPMLIVSDAAFGKTALKAMEDNDIVRSDSPSMVNSFSDFVYVQNEIIKYATMELPSNPSVPR